jgi:hypothetical protein
MLALSHPLTTNGMFVVKQFRNTSLACAKIVKE